MKKDITFLDKEILPEYQEERGVIFDIYCKTESGEEFIVEMQNKQHIHFKERPCSIFRETSPARARKEQNGNLT